MLIPITVMGNALNNSVRYKEKTCVKKWAVSQITTIMINLLGISNHSEAERENFNNNLIKKRSVVNLQMKELQTFFRILVDLMIENNSKKSAKSKVVLDLKIVKILSYQKWMEKSGTNVTKPGNKRQQVTEKSRHADEKFNCVAQAYKYKS